MELVNGRRKGTCRHCGDTAAKGRAACNPCRVKHRKFTKSPFGPLRNTYRHNARKGGNAWELSLDQCIEIFSTQECYYCGGPPTSRIQGRILYMGIDRRDNDLGYLPENVVPACKYCNRMKQDLTESEFLAHLKRVVNHMK